jgi:hypothetical protein
MAKRKDPGSLSGAGSTRRGTPPLRQSSGQALRIIPNKNRVRQVAPTRRKLFDAAAEAEFLEWFAATCNISLAARKAGFHYRTVLRHWREDPAFGDECQAALGLGYIRLEALAVRSATEALTRKPRRVKGDRPAPPETLAMDPMTALQLLREHKRGVAGLPGGSGRGAKPGPAPKKWTFEEAIVALDKKLRALGVRHGIPDDAEGLAEPPPDARGAGETDARPA